MVGEWRSTRLGDLIEVKHGFAFEGRLFRDAPPGDILVTPGNFKIGGGFSNKSLRFYAGQAPQGFVLSPGDLIVTMTDLSKAGDTLGYAALVPVDGRRYLHNQRIGRVALRAGAPLYLRFAHWLMRAPAYRAEVLGSATGSTVRHTSPSRIEAFSFRLPPMREQELIAGVLDALDDKIELNRRMAATLEAMARTLFKSWFIDFDPVHAKAERRPTGLPDDLAALFPDRIGKDGLPSGWVAKPLSGLASFLNGLALQKYPADDDGPSLPVIKIAELRTGPTPKSGKASVDVPAEYQVQDGDHLFSWSGSLTHCRWTYGTGALNQHLFKVTPIEPYPAWLVYEAVDRHMPEFQAIASGKAVTMGHIQRHHLDEAKVAIPAASLLKAVNAVFAPVYDRWLAADVESRTLTELRDTLLPKLISGELRIADAEKKVSAA